MCSAVWIPVNCGAAQAGQNGQEDCHAVSGDVRPQVLQGNGPAADSGSLIGKPSSRYIEAAQRKSRRNGIGPSPAGPNETSQAAASTLVLSSSPRCPEPRRDGQRVGRTPDRAGAGNLASGPHAHGLGAPPVHDHTSSPRRTGRVLASGTAEGHGSELNGRGCPPSGSRHGTCAGCPRRGVFRYLTG